MLCDLEVTNESARCWEKKFLLYDKFWYFAGIYDGIHLLLQHRGIFLRTNNQQSQTLLRLKERENNCPEAEEVENGILAEE